MMQRKPNSF
jgi:hypothetical protein